MSCSLAECKGERLHARVEEFDFEGSIDDRRRLPDELIEPLFVDRAIAALIDVRPWAGPGGWPSSDTRKRAATPRRGGPMTR